MTQKTLSGLILIVIVSLISFKSFGTTHTVKTTTDLTLTQDLTEEPVSGHLMTNKAPFFPAPEHKENHGKAHSPQMDETPHIHKFHRERIKKVRKHHSKLWIISQLILLLCHISILIIAFLHVTH